MTELITLTRYQLPQNIELHWHVADELSWQLPEYAFRRSLLNLILNARQAIGDNAGCISLTATQEQDTLIIEVSDNGPGFPDTLLLEGIRPFATTRNTGTGLGLLSVQRFVFTLHGDIRLSNQAPLGASVRMAIPHQGTSHA